MGVDVADYRRIAGQWEKSDSPINAAAAALIILNLCGEIERLQNHRCLWGNDPSGPTFSDEYLASLSEPPA